MMKHNLLDSVAYLQVTYMNCRISFVFDFN